MTEKRGGKRKGAGRKPTGEPVRRGRMFAATDEEIKEIDQKAADEGMSRAQYIRWKTLGKKD